MNNILIFIAQLTVITGVCWLALKLVKRSSPQLSQNLISVCFIICLILPLLRLSPFSINPYNFLTETTTIEETAAQEWNDVYLNAPQQPPMTAHVTQYLASAQNLESQPVTEIVLPEFKHEFNWYQLLIGLWLVGFVVSLVYRFRQFLQIHRIIQRGEAYDLIQDKAYSNVRVRISKEIEVPFLFVARHPYLVVPERMLDVGDGHLDHIIQHELCHYRRGDHWSMWLGLITSSAYWFHPLVKHLRLQQKQAMEEACDEQLLNEGINRYNYAETLLFVAKYNLNNPLVAHMAAEPKLLKSRINAIVNNSKLKLGKKRKTVLTFCAVVVFLTGCIDHQAQAFMNASEVVKLISQDFDSFRSAKLSKGHFYLTLMYDGAQDQETVAELEVISRTGQKTWLVLGPLKKFTEVVYTWHFKLLNGAALSGRYRINGVIPDGVVDGVAMGLLVSDFEGNISIKKTKSEIIREIPNIVCSWPLKIEEFRFMTLMPQLSVNNPDSAERMICGAMLMGNGEFTLQ
ncbi:M56 family metallopeptidase [Marinicella sp. W31]|uniref:M56 family metallopeptidase n=1 Tax=Marinicella sp. W31 TaxID=3023713 RepID=UPI003757F8F5